MSEDQALSEKYQSITDANIKRRGEEFDDIGEHLAKEMYSERTHFIYELLQNAEDALARRFALNPASTVPRRIRFSLFPDRLEVRHFGQPFNDNDIASISDVFKSTKTGCVGLIGKKGIGFKSVYAFTDLPEVHSGRERFQIYRYIRLRPAPPQQLGADETLFIFPLSGNDAAKKSASLQIRQGLERVSQHALLFLRHLSEIYWCDEDRAHGHYQHTSHDVGNAQRVQLCSHFSSFPDERSQAQEWLIFHRPVKPPGAKETLAVEVAFRLSKAAPPHEFLVETEPNTRLLVYFPTKRETHMGFLIQGPFKTIANREDIHEPVRDDPHDWNRYLAKETGELVVEALRWLKAADLLTVKVLECLPIDSSQFLEDSPFSPIYGTVRDALRNEELLPTFSTNQDQRTFAVGERIKIAASTELRALVGRDQLSKLTGAKMPLSWLSPDISERRTPELWRYLRQELGVEEINTADFLSLLTAEFLAEQSDEWIGDLYEFLARHTWLLTVNRDRLPPLIRVKDGSQIRPFKVDGSPAAFLPSKRFNDHVSVKQTITEMDRTQPFFRCLDYTVADECDDVLRNLLPKYEKGILPALDEYERDIARIFSVLKTTDSVAKKKALAEKLKSLRYLSAINPTTGKHAAKMPGEVYFRSPDLDAYFQGNPNCWFVAPELEKHKKMLSDLGVKETVRVKRRKPNPNGHVVIEDRHGNHERGLNGFDPNCTIDGLEYAIQHPTPVRSEIVWKLLASHTGMIYGTVEASSRKEFHSPTKREDFSSIGSLATERPWLPFGNTFRRPNELSLDELPANFQKNDTLAQKLRMKTPQHIAVVNLAREADVSPEDVEYLKKHKDEFEQFKRWLTEQTQKPKRPVAESRDPLRRENEITEQTRLVPPVDRQVRLRTIRPNWATKEEARATLREWYQNVEGQMVCQVCCCEMPFKLDDGSYHFESVECVKGVSHELPQIYIALCPVCAAKYQHANGTTPSELKQRLLAARDFEEPVPVTLAREECDIFFTQVHLHDAQTAIRTLEGS